MQRCYDSASFDLLLSDRILVDANFAPAQVQRNISIVLSMFYNAYRVSYAGLPVSKNMLIFLCFLYVATSLGAYSFLSLG